METWTKTFGPLVVHKWKHGLNRSDFWFNLDPHPTQEHAKWKRAHPPMCAEKDACMMGRIFSPTSKASPVLRRNFAVSHNQNQVVKWSTQNHAKNSEGGRNYFWLGLPLANLHLPGVKPGKNSLGNTSQILGCRPLKGPAALAHTNCDRPRSILGVDQKVLYMG